MRSGSDGSLESESTGGHSRMIKMRQKATRRYYWKGMTEDIKEFIRMCDRCQRKKNYSTAENSSDNEKYSNSTENFQPDRYRSHNHDRISRLQVHSYHL